MPGKLPVSYGSLFVMGLVLGTIGITSLSTARAETTFATSGNSVSMTTGGAKSNTLVSIYYAASNYGDLTVGSPGLAAFTNSTYIGLSQQAYGAGGYSGSTYSGTGDAASYIGPGSAYTGTGFYDYRFTFDGAAGSNFIGHALGDNEIQNVFVDGVRITLTSPDISNRPVGGLANVPSAGDFSSILASGSSHTFDIVVYNHDGSTNVAVEGRTMSAVGEPGVMITTGSLLGVTTLGLIGGYRRSKRAAKIGKSPGLPA